MKNSIHRQASIKRGILDIPTGSLDNLVITKTGTIYFKSDKKKNTTNNITNKK